MKGVESTGNPESSHFLNGWKEIAEYLGRGVRTAQRYERELHLPVRRPADKPRSAVLATRAEIDAWVVTNFRLDGIDWEDFTCLSQKAALSAIKNSIAEMHHLREEMTKLRAGLRTSAREFHLSLATLHTALNQRPRQ